MDKSNRHKKTPVRPGTEVSGVNNLEDSHVIENTTATTNVIPFRKAELLLIEKDGEAFVPMKPIVEGMGLDWGTQFRKLQGGRFSSTVVEMTMVALDGKEREMTCIPLRKLAGWLMSVHPGKIKDVEVKQRVIDYQNECDDVLWAYWSEKLKSQQPAIHTGLTPQQQRHIQQQVAVLAKQPGNSFAAVYSSIKDRFMVGSYKDVRPESYAALCHFLGSEPLEGEWLGQQEAVAHSNPGGIELNADETQDLYLIMCHLGRLVDMHPTFHKVGSALSSPMLIEAFTNLYDVQSHWNRLKRTKGESLAKIHQARMSRYERASA